MIEFFLGLSLGLLVGWKIGEWFMTYVFTQLMQKLGIQEQQLRDLHRDIIKDPEKSTEQARIQIRLEHISGSFYAYRADTEQFLGQGPDQDTLFRSIQQRFPMTNFVIQGADAELLRKSHT